MAKPDWISVVPADGEGEGQVEVIVSQNYLASMREGTVTVKTNSGITKQVTVGQMGVIPYCVIQNDTFNVEDSQKVNVLFRGSGMVQFKGTGALFESGTATVYASTKEPTGGGFLDPNDDSWVECVRSGQTTWTIPDGAFYLKVAFTAHEYMGAVQTMNITVYGSGSSSLYTGTTTVNIQQTPTAFQFNALTPSYSVPMNPFSDAIFKFNLKSDLVTFKFIGETYKITPTSIAYNEGSNPSASGSLWTECRGDIMGSGLTLNWRNKQYFNLKFNGYYNWTGSSVTLTLQATDVNSGKVQTQTITFNKAY